LLDDHNEALPPPATVPAR